MTRSIIQEKSFRFAVQIVKFCSTLRAERQEYEISRQLLRAGTSIGANVTEALGGQSRRDFASKLAIAAKEARETRYWLQLIVAADLSSYEPTSCLISECEELLKILNSIILTCRDTEALPTTSNTANS